MKKAEIPKKTGKRDFTFDISLIWTYNKKDIIRELISEFRIQEREKQEMHLQRVSKHFPSFLRKGTERFVVSIWLFYINIVAKTSKVQLNGIENIDQNRMIGFWHEDSYCVQLILRELQRQGKVVDVIVTKERRGDYIADMIKRYGARPLRLPDGQEMRPFLKALKKDSMENGKSLAAAMDGPSGPYRKAKRLLFLLAHESQKGITFARFEKKGMLCLPWRWDKFRIPLPFSKIKCKIDFFGPITQFELKNFDEYMKLKLSE